MPTRPELPIPELHGDSRDSVPKAQLRGGNRINAPFNLNLIGYALMVNSLMLFEHRQRPLSLASAA